MPGVMRDALTMLLDPAAPLRIPLAYLPKAAPWLMRFVRASRPDAVRRIADALSTLLATSIERHADMLRDVGAPDILRRTGQLYLYPDEKALRKDTMSWALRREHGLKVDELGRADILALEPEVETDYTVGMFTPEQGMSINPEWPGHGGCRRLCPARRAHRARSHHRGRHGGRSRARGARRGRELPGPSCGDLAGAWSTQLLAGLGYEIPLESQRGYHVAIPSPGIAVGRPVIAADRKVFLTPMEEGLRVAGTVEFGGLARAPTRRRAEYLVRDLTRVFPRESPGRLVILDGTPAVPAGIRSPSWDRAAIADCGSASVTAISG